MNEIWLRILAVVIAYLIGNISPSILLAKAKGIDIRKEGSGNAGTTNALRVMGKKAGAITLIVDVLKGTAAVLLGLLLAGHVGRLDTGRGMLPCDIVFHAARVRMVRSRAGSDNTRKAQSKHRQTLQGAGTGDEHI